MDENPLTVVTEPMEVWLRQFCQLSWLVTAEGGRVHVVAARRPPTCWGTLRGARAYPVPMLEQFERGVHVSRLRESGLVRTVGASGRFGGGARHQADTSARREPHPRELDGRSSPARRLRGQRGVMMTSVVRLPDLPISSISHHRA